MAAARAPELIPSLDEIVDVYNKAIPYALQAQLKVKPLRKLHYAFKLLAFPYIKMIVTEQEQVTMIQDVTFVKRPIDGQFVRGKSLPFVIIPLEDTLVPYRGQVDAVKESNHPSYQKLEDALSTLDGLTYDLERRTWVWNDVGGTYQNLLARALLYDMNNDIGRHGVAKTMTLVLESMQFDDRVEVFNVGNTSNTSSSSLSVVVWKTTDTTNDSGSSDTALSSSEDSDSSQRKRLKKDHVNLDSSIYHKFVQPDIYLVASDTQNSKRPIYLCAEIKSGHHYMEARKESLVQLSQKALSLMCFQKELYSIYISAVEAKLYLFSKSEELVKCTLVKSCYFVKDNKFNVVAFRDFIKCVFAALFHMSRVEFNKIL